MLDQLVQRVEHARDDVINAVQDLRPDQAAFKPSPDTWSVAENVERLYLAELSGVTKIWAAPVRFAPVLVDAMSSEPGQPIEP